MASDTCTKFEGASTTCRTVHASNLLWCAPCLRAALEAARRMATARADIAERVITQRDEARRGRDEARAARETAERDTEARIVAWLSRRASEGGPPGSLAWADEWWAVRDAIERGDHRKGADDGE